MISPQWIDAKYIDNGGFYTCAGGISSYLLDMLAMKIPFLLM